VKTLKREVLKCSGSASLWLARFPIIVWQLARQMPVLLAFRFNDLTI
jgi:hypothetical protein